MPSAYLEFQSTSRTTGFGAKRDPPAEIRHEVTPTAAAHAEGGKFDWSLDVRSSTVDRSEVSEHELTHQLKHDLRYAQDLRKERAQLLRAASGQALDPSAARRVRLLDWMLDRAEMAAMGDDLDRLDRVARAYEELAEQVRSLTEAVAAPRRNDGRRSR